MNKPTAIAPSIQEVEASRFMLFVKKYLEQNHPVLTSTKLDNSSAFISFFDSTYGIVSIMFYRTKGHIFNYQASSNAFTNLSLISSEEYKGANGKFKVMYRKEDGQIDFYNINVGKKVS